MKGKFIVVTGPSASGKTEITRALLKKFPDSTRHVTTTTRLPRPGEENGKDYFFLSRDEFEKGIAAGDFFEYAEVYGELYGSSKKTLDKNLGKFRYVFGSIDVQGAETYKKKLEDVFIIFIRPGSVDDLQRRLSARVNIPDQEMKKRMETSEAELSLAQSFDAVVENIDGKFDETMEKVLNIISNIEKL